MSAPILEKCKDYWTNTFDYFWMLDGKVFSPYFSNEDDAHKWLKDIYNKSNNCSSVRA